MHLYLCPIYYLPATTLGRVLKPIPLLVPWILSLSFQKYHSSSYPLSLSIIKFPSLLDHSDQYKQGIISPILKTNKQTQIPPQTYLIYHLLLFLCFIYTQTEKLAYSYCLHFLCSHSFLNPPLSCFCHQKSTELFQVVNGVIYMFPDYLTLLSRA